jgi:hypothetical protein
MKTLDQLTSRELETELLRRAIHRADVEIARQVTILEILHQKQTGRIRELAIQETLLKSSIVNHKS